MVIWSKYGQGMGMADMVQKRNKTKKKSKTPSPKNHDTLCPGEKKSIYQSGSLTSTAFGLWRRIATSSTQTNAAVNGLQKKVGSDLVKV